MKIRLPNLFLGQEKDFFIEQLAILLASGMPVVEALSAIKMEIRSKQLKDITERIAQDIEAGSAVSKALSETGIFPNHVISLIRIGEQSGKLPENLKVIALQQEKERSFRSKVTSAMMYPLFVFCLTLVVGIGIAWFILPRLASVFSELRIPLPFITHALIASGNFLGQYGAIVIPISLVLMLLLLFFLFVNPRTNYIGQAILFTVPAVRRLFQELELARFGYILGNLLEAGLPVVDAVNALVDATTLYRYKKFYANLKTRVDEGNSFQKSFKLYPNTNTLIPIQIQQLIISAEQSGHLSQTFKEIGEMYDGKIENTTKNLTVLLEPILLVIVWLGVVAVAVAVILPLYSLIGGLNTQPSITHPSQTIQTIASPEAKLQEKIATKSAVKKLEVLSTGVDFLNVRDEPSLKGKIITKIKPGEVYEYQDTKNNWYKIVREASPSGWVFGDYVKEIKP